MEVSRIDEEGKPSRVSQWLIELEAPVDPTALLRHDDGLDALELRAAEAANVLQGQGIGAGAAGTVISEDGVIEMPAAAAAPERAREPRQAEPDRSAAARPAGAAAQASARPSEASRAAPAGGKSSGGEGGAEEKEVAWLFDAAAALGVDADAYERYATKRWGQGWKKAAGGRKRALDDITPFQDDAAGFVEKVKGELEVWA